MAEDDLVERNLRWLLKNREDQREGNLCVCVCERYNICANRFIRFGDVYKIRN